MSEGKLVIKLLMKQFACVAVLIHPSRWLCSKCVWTPRILHEVMLIEVHLLYVIMYVKSLSIMS